VKSPGEDLYLVVLSELKDLDAALRGELGRIVEERLPWGHLPPKLQAAFEQWADLLGPWGVA